MICKRCGKRGRPYRMVNEHCRHCDSKKKALNKINNLEKVTKLQKLWDKVTNNG